MQHPQTHRQVEGAVAERWRENIGLDEVDAGQVARVLIRRVHRVAVVHADVRPAVAVHDLREAAHAAARIQHQFAAQVAQRKAEAGLQSVARIGAACRTVQLRVSKLLPLVREAAGIRVLRDEARDPPQHGKACSRSHVRRPAWMSSSSVFALNRDRQTGQRSQASSEAFNRTRPWPRTSRRRIVERHTSMQKTRRSLVTVLAIALTLLSFQPGSNGQRGRRRLADLPSLRRSCGRRRKWQHLRQRAADVDDQRPRRRGVRRAALRGRARVRGNRKQHAVLHRRGQWRPSVANASCRTRAGQRAAVRQYPSNGWYHGHADDRYEHGSAVCGGHGPAHQLRAVRR